MYYSKSLGHAVISPVYFYQIHFTLQILVDFSVTFSANLYLKTVVLAIFNSSPIFSLTYNITEIVPFNLPMVFTLINPIFNCQCSFYLTYQQHLTQMISSSIWKHFLYFTFMTPHFSVCLFVFVVSPVALSFSPLMNPPMSLPYKH